MFGFTTSARAELAEVYDAANTSNKANQQEACCEDSNCFLSRFDFVGYLNDRWGTDCNPNPWSVNFTQTADYGTNLALPIGLTPANTLVSPVGNPGQANILNYGLVQSLGLLNNFGLSPVVTPIVPSVPVFRDDFQFQTSAGGQYKSVIDQDTTLTTGYNFYQNLHPKLEQLNLTSHTLSTQLDRRMTDRLTGTLNYFYSYYFLNGNSFVSQNNVGASVFFKKDSIWDFKTGVNYANANFRGAQFLNSDNYSARVETFRHLGEGSLNYLTAGYAVGYSQAQLRGFSYNVNNVFVGGHWAFGCDNKSDFTLLGSFASYDFLATDPIQTGTFRHDNIFNVNANIGRSVNQYVRLFLTFNYLNSESNVIRQQYDSNLVSIGMTYRR